MKINQHPPQEEIDQLKSLLGKGKCSLVFEHAEAIIQNYPNSFIVWNLLGVAAYEIKRFDYAIMSYKKAISINPKYEHAYNNLGILLRDQGKLDSAIEAYEKAISNKPDNSLFYNNLSALLSEQGKDNEAIEACKKAILLKSDYAEAYNNLGAILRDQGKITEAIEACKKAILIKPDYAEAYNNLGAILRDQGKIFEALEACNKAILLKPNYAEAYNNLGAILRDQGKISEAIEACNKAVLLKPDYAEAYYSLSFSHNLKGDLENGFKLHEWRLREKRFIARTPRKYLIWDGKKSLLGKKFFVYEEQGLGDIIQFSRYLLLLKKKGAEVTFKVKKRMHALLKTLDEDIILVENDPDYNNIDFETPLMSLPYLFKTQLNTIPSMTSYLYADHKKVKLWSEGLTEEIFKVGICWQGSMNKIDFGRSFPLTLFQNISKLQHVKLISLHKGEGEKQIKDISFDLKTLGDDFDAGENAFEDTAAIIMNCDLIITSDTAIAHLAGALGCPTWVVLKKIPDWRWMLEQNDSPWYPSIKLYRQKKRDNWNNVFEIIKKDLELLLTQKKE